MGRKERRAQLARNKRLAGKSDSTTAPHGVNPLMRAVQLYRSGRLAEAREIADSLIRGANASAQAFSLHGTVCWRMGDLVTAVESFKRATNRGATDFDTLYRLGSALAALGRHEEALPVLDQTLVLNPQQVDLHNFRGLTLGKLGRTEEAIAALRTALDMDADRDDVHANLASLLERVNRIDEAWEAAQAGLARFPGNPSLQLTAARCERRRGDLQAAVKRLEGQSQSVAHANPTLAASMQQELGRIYDALSDTDAAFESFSRAGQIAAREWAARHPGPNAAMAEAEALSSIATPGWVASWSSAASSSETSPPVFLIGFPRSGTTLLERVLDSHPAIQTLEEQPTIKRVRDEVDGLPGGYPAALAHLSAGQQNRLRKRYYKEVDARIARRAGVLTIDKMPLNIVHVPLIHRLFPDARFILALRHPCDVCLSCFMQAFRPNHAMANFFTLADTVAFYTAVMGLWQRYIEIMPLNCLTVRYENLVADFNGEVRRVLAFLGLQWDDAVLDYGGQAALSKRINTPSYHQVAKPIYQDAVFRWQRYASPFSPFQAQLEPFVRAFGYAQDAN